MKSLNKYSWPAIGCYFDCAAGQADNDHRVLILAKSFGFRAKGLTANLRLETDGLTDDEFEDRDSFVQDAIDFLNGKETRSFLTWDWHEGDFGLFPDFDSAHENADFVSSKEQEYPADDFRGEWLHVNDHGNATLYSRGADGKDVEVWSVV